jgi:hypothetical protein
MRDLRTALRMIQTALGLAFWALGTIWSGGKALWRSAILLSRWRRITAEVAFCGRQHEVPLYGLWDCACGSRFEGWAFAACAVCRETAAYVPCGVCGLPVRNPLLV